MATGGAAGEEELYSFELFECSVCLESLINKQPRLLSCGHTFCTPCLQQLLRGNTVNCPKCRSPTLLSSEGVQALPKNTDISKMREREQELSARNENFCHMCKNRYAKVEFICTSCSKRLICRECFKKHKRIPAFKAHNVLPIAETLPVKQTHENCEKHGELLEYFCLQCEEAICVTCTCGPQHEEHCDQIVELKTGLKELKALMNILCQEFKENATKVEECAKIIKKDTNSIKEYKDALSAKCDEVETVLNQMKEQLKVITGLYQPLRHSCEKINTHLADVQKQMTKINNLQQCSDVDFIQKIKECRTNCDRVMNDTHMILNRKITIPENMKQNIEIVGYVGQLKTKKLSLADVAQTAKPEIKAETEQEVRPSPRQADKNNELNNLELLSEIKPGGIVDMLDPLEVVSVGDGTVILVDNELNYIQRINTEGVVVREYQVTLNQNVPYRHIERMYRKKFGRYQTTSPQEIKCKSSCVYGNYMFVASSDNAITKMLLRGYGCDVKHKPGGVRTIGHISGSGDNVILISEGQWDGRILEYNTETNQFIERVTDVWFPGRVNVAHAGYDTKYIVKCNQPFSDESRVNIYNRDWNLISTIDKNADVLTVTPGGKLLIVYKNRIHEYSQDGTFIKGLLDKYKFKNIQDITWSGGCLWVLEANPCCIKVFVAN